MTHPLPIRIALACALFTAVAPPAALAATLLARRSGDRVRDLPDELCRRVAERLRALRQPESWVHMVEAVVELDEADRKLVDWALRKFEETTTVLAGLDHPGIVHYIESGRTDQGEPYFAMEWLEGEDLATRLSREALTLSDSLHMLTAVASALALALGEGADLVAGEVLQEHALDRIADLEDLGAGGGADQDVLADGDDAEDVLLVGVEDHLRVLALEVEREQLALRTCPDEQAALAGLVAMP